MSLSISIYDKYELVVGLEVHAQLSTQSKAFSPDRINYHASANTQVHPISLGHPGTLPVINAKMIEYAIRMGLATNCQIREKVLFDRKNYFYADLPKGFQTTQHTMPICYDGFVCVKPKNTAERRLGIHHIHMEDDAGKSLHDTSASESFVDLNRAGVPLIEIVTKPDIHTAEEAGLFLTEVRKILRYLKICDGNMEEGSMRCDANISVRLKGSLEYGRRCEVKNMNSIRSVQRAIEYEFKRQIDWIEAGLVVEGNTLSFDQQTGKTSVLRSKEIANDYRYFPEPDLPPVILSSEFIQQIKESLPALPQTLISRYEKQYGLTYEDACTLTTDPDISAYFDILVKHTPYYKSAANWLNGKIRSHLNEKGLSIHRFSMNPKRLAELIELTEAGKVNRLKAVQFLFPAMLDNPDYPAEQLAEKLGLLIDADNDAILLCIDQIMNQYPDKVKEYQSGRKNLIAMFMGELMKLSKGKVDPKMAKEILAERLSIKNNSTKRT